MSIPARSLGAIAAAALLLGLLAAGIAAPGRLLGAPEDRAPVMERLAHAGPHDAPQVLCPAPTTSATLVAKETPWATSRRDEGPAWTFNGEMPGPVLCAAPGATFALTLTNALPQPLAFHVHDLGDATTLAPGETRTLTLAIPDDATGVHAYHATDAAALARGLGGVMIVRAAPPTNVDHEVVLTLAETHRAGSDQWAATIDGRAFPDAPRLQLLPGERMLVHIVDLGEAVHTLHIHGHRWFDLDDGRAIDNKFVTPHLDTMPGSTDHADFVIVAGEPGEWMYHCHVYDHINAGMTGSLVVLEPDGGAPQHGH